MTLHNTPVTKLTATVQRLFLSHTLSLSSQRQRLHLSCTYYEKPEKNAESREGDDQRKKIEEALPLLKPELIHAQVLPPAGTATPNGRKWMCFHAIRFFLNDQFSDRHRPYPTDVHPYL